MHRLVIPPAVALLLAACGSPAPPASPPPTLPEPGADGEYSPDWPDLGRGEERFIGLDLGPDSLAICRRVSPKFPFDSPKTRAQDRAQLAALASCLNHPEMASRTVLLVGRADPRGSDAYNQELAMKRAKRIKEILIANNLAESRIRVASQGEKGAVGDQPEYSYGYDRRVDVVILGGVHTP